MRHRMSADFRRGLKVFCKQQGLLLEEVVGRAQTDRVVIFGRASDGETRRVATLVLRKEPEEIPRAVALAIMRKLEERIGEEVANNREKFVLENLRSLEVWLQSAFSEAT